MLKDNIMADSVQKVLFVNSEMEPYLPQSPIASLCRQLPQGIQERRKEIRAFMPKYGCINERKNQLHEVIRLSGMNIIISDVDRPLVIKVASISSARIQVYFIDNEDYFRRKQIYRDRTHPRRLQPRPPRLLRHHHRHRLRPPHGPHPRLLATLRRPPSLRLPPRQEPPHLRQRIPPPDPLSLRPHSRPH